MPGLTNRDNTNKTTFMFSFLLGLCFAFIYVLCYGLLTGVLYRYCSLPVPELVNSILHSVLISVAGTALCCVFFLLKEKELVPGGFLWLAFIVGVAYLFTLVHFEGEERRTLLVALTLFCPAPVLIGNGTAWLIYNRLKRKGY